MTIELSNQCPIRTTLELVGGKWKLLIIKQLSEKPMRFVELGKTIPALSEKVLNEELKDLLESGLIEKFDHYTLTELGKTTLPLIEQMAAFGDAYQKQRMAEL